MKVLFVAPSLDIVGGQSIQADLLMRGLRSDPSVDVSFVPINPRLPGPLRAIQAYRFVRTGPTFAWYVAQLLSAIRRCDVLHVFSASYFSFLLAPTPAILLGRLLGKPVLLNYHSGEAEDHFRRWKSAVATLRLAQALVVPSQYLVDVFARFGLHATPIFNAVDLSAFRFRSRSPLRPKFLVNRNFEAHYNVPCVLRAYQLLLKRWPEASLTVAGDGPERERLRALAAELELSRVDFVGRVAPANMPALYDRHDVFLNGSDIDNMPLSILEAYACGLPVVTTNAGGIPYIVDDGRTGLLVHRNDHAGLARAAERLLEEPGLASRLAANGLAECPNYTWERIRPEWVRLYRALADGRH